MPQLAKPEYEHLASDGKTLLKFKLKPTTENNRNRLLEYTKEYQGRLNEYVAAIQKKEQNLRVSVESGIEVQDDAGEIPEPESDSMFWLNIFKLITEGPHDKLAPADFDIKLAEVAKQDFLPESARMTAQLLEYLRS